MLKFLASLRSWQLFVLAAVLFAVDLVIPDPIPFLDETLLAVLTYTLARWKKPPAQPVTPQPSHRRPRSKADPPLPGRPRR